MSAQSSVGGVVVEPRLPVLLAAVAAVTVASLAGANSLYGDRHPGLWLFLALLIPVIWGYVELAQHRGSDPEAAAAIMTAHRVSFAAIGLLLAVLLSSRLALLSGALDPSWQPLVPRVKALLYGIFWLVWGNYVPKLPSPWGLREEPFDWQAVHRFAGRLAFVVGLAMIVSSLALPLDQLRPVSEWLTVTLIVLMVGRKFFSLATHRRAG